MNGVEGKRQTGHGMQRFFDSTSICSINCFQIFRVCDFSPPKKLKIVSSECLDRGAELFYVTNIGNISRHLDPKASPSLILTQGNIPRELIWGQFS